ncbi:uncharacterized protein LOC100908942 [Galendromus occidentalis]|uniref:Uncharacterized protein LOC100908942 n=1 Tax=Galendromus occidentalis TaxID=34638 RepID=A0AAJ6VZ21_9ACAR|nr:uncharacterized protein LOC100908942 [Galendromus occidentalis]
MVTLTSVLAHWVKTPANRYWKRRRVFIESGHFYGRSRNCYAIAIRRLEKAWTNAKHGRADLKKTTSQTWQSRISASTESLGLNYFPFAHGLAHQQVALGKKVLADLAWSEPRSFRSLVELARNDACKDPAHIGEPNENVILGSEGVDK